MTDARKLQTLEEFNQQKLLMSRIAKLKYPNGIACPNCGKELYDADLTEALLSDPPQTRVECICGFSSTRFM